MPSNQERTATARTTLIDAARKLFGANGYANTTTLMIAEATGLTRGALYHHFNGKLGLFEAVIEAEFVRINVQIDDHAQETTDPLEALIEGGDAFISAMSDPVSQRLILIDAPIVLSRQRLLDLDNETTTLGLKDGIEAAQAAKRLPDLPSAALTSLMSGAYDRAVLDGLGENEASQQDAREAIRTIWFGLSKLA